MTIIIYLDKSVTVWWFVLSLEGATTGIQHTSTILVGILELAFDLSSFCAIWRWGRGFDFEPRK